MTTSVKFARFSMACATILALSCAPETGNFVISVVISGAEFGSISSDSPELSCRGACKISAKANSTIELHPITTSIGEFQGWSGDCNGTGICKITVSSDANITAVFGPKAYSLHVDVNGPGSGAVRLPDGSACTKSCNVPILAGQRIHLTALAHPDSYFDTWSGSCTAAETNCDLDAAESLSVTAHFAKKVRLDITGVDAETEGTVTSTPSGISCGSTCTGWFLPGQHVTLTANSTDGLWRFRGWTGADCSDSTCEVTMDTDKAIRVNFESTHVWSRSFGYTTGFAANTVSGGNLTVAVTSQRAQDFGSGPVMPKSSASDNLFVARLDSGGVPLFTKVFGGSAKVTNPIVIREVPAGGVSILMGVLNPGGTSELSVDLGNYEVVVAPGEFTLAHVDLNSSGDVTGAGLVDASFEYTTVVQSGSSTFAINADLNSGGDTISRLGPDWTRDWTLTNPKQQMRFFAGPADTIWAITPEVPVEMDCAGGPAANGALLQIDATGSCNVVWPYPPGLSVDSAQAPGGAMLMDVAYLDGFEFAGDLLPDPPMFLSLHARLRFDELGNPVWSRNVIRGASSGQYVRDAVQLDNGEVLMAGFHSGISDFDPTVPEPKLKEYLATYSEQTGEALWHYSFGQMPDRTSYASFDFLAPLSNGRVALWGAIRGTFDFGGGPVWSPTDSNHFIAVYQF